MTRSLREMLSWRHPMFHFSLNHGARLEEKQSGSILYQHINTLSILKMPPYLCRSAVCTAFVISIIIAPYRYPWGFNHESPRHPTNAHRPDRYPHHTSQSPGSFKFSHPHTFFRTGTWTVEQCLSLSTKKNPSSLSSFISKACRPHCNDVLRPGRPK